MQPDHMTALTIRSIRNATDGKLTLINLAEPESPGHKVTLRENGWKLCEINIPSCETSDDWDANHRISLQLNKPKPSKSWIFRTEERIYTCTSTEFSDRHLVDGDPEVGAEEDRYLSVNEDGTIVIVKASFWLSSKWSPS